MLTRYKENMNKIILNYKKKGTSFLNTCSEEELGEIVLIANKGYYNNDKPIMSDLQYDKLKLYIEDTYPSSKINKIVPHTTITITKNKVKLPYEMWSMDKIIRNEKVKKKLKSLDNDLLISAKLDGISLMISTEMGKVQLFTRGNGKYGQDVSHLAPYLNIPSVPYATIRGELLIKKDVFNKKYKKDFANARNFVSGMVNSKTINTDMIKDLDFVAYELIEPQRTPYDQFHILEKFNFNVVKYLQKPLKSKLSLEELQSIYKKWRHSYDYEIDGLIICNNEIVPRITGNPKHAWAFKMILEEQIASSIVKEVIWSASKDGHLKPKIRIKPVKLCGAKITYVTVHNELWRRNNGIDVGAEIEIIRSGDVIPKVHKVIKKVDVKNPPDNYKVVLKGVDYVLLNPEENSEVRMKELHAFFVQIGTEGIGKGNIKKIMNAGYDNVQDILNMSYDDFMKVEGFKEKTSLKLVESIKQSMNSVELPELMIATNIFGRGLGVKKIRIIMNAYPNILLEKETYDKKIEKISKLEGFKEKSAKKFVDHIVDFIKFININKLQYKVLIQNKKSVHISHPLNNKKIVITGFRNKQFENKLKNIGVKLMTSISKTTDLLIYNGNKKSSKLMKADNLNIKKIHLIDFINKYKMDI